MTTTEPPPPAPPPDAFPTLDAHCDRIIANLTRRLANRPRPAPPCGEPMHDFFVLGFLPDLMAPRVEAPNSANQILNPTPPLQTQDRNPPPAPPVLFVPFRG